ncbi:MAG: FTR1 family iron permease [Sodalis sp. (in: enterobacteria)]
MLVLSIFFSTSVWAKTQYISYIEDIEQRLDNTVELYQQQKNTAARYEVQMAYFEVFENLEGPIRINISARKSYEMESAFGEIRQMISEKKPIIIVQNKIAVLKKMLREVQPLLDGGHKLVAEGRHVTLSHPDITVYWRDSFSIIDNLLAEAVNEYQAGHYDIASQRVKQAHFQGFKNSEMEISIRQQRSAKNASAINQQFTALSTLSAQSHSNINDMSYQVTILLQDIEDMLPGLSNVRDYHSMNEVKIANSVSSALNTVVPDTDWKNVTAGINKKIMEAIKHCYHDDGSAKDAILIVQDTYFECFEATGMENKIGSRDASFKTQLENHFIRLISLMKAGQTVEMLTAEARTLQQDLEKAATILCYVDEETQWSLLLYSLMIIVREGLEALLIIVAIVSYLVKNNHSDKLPLIRQSIIVALLASVVTAALFHFLYANAGGASRELLEGITMLIASVMLFFVSYWFLSKVEARCWKTWLEDKLSCSLSRNSLIGLWLISFLAVYREGAETVLFYYALIGDAHKFSDHIAIGAGFAIGCVMLSLTWLIMRYSVIRLSLKPFFVLTGSFMYLMAFVFSGKGVLELVEGKLFHPTLVVGIPEIAFLGIYPYLETLFPQAVLLLAALFAFWMMYRSRYRH